MKPALRTVWIVVYSLVGAIAALLLLYLITALAAFLWAAAALAAAMLIFELAFWRCPACGGFLGPVVRSTKFCPLCGARARPVGRRPRCGGRRAPAWR